MAKKSGRASFELNLNQILQLRKLDDQRGNDFHFKNLLIQENELYEVEGRQKESKKNYDL